ncbi:hypothetical protein [Mucilaginibacter sp. SJ]|uniref:hypothetical protein n=1 Tax=Mucilaginibacter sp. SJ TaxID=3029053 RepID=UPI0023A916DF|nr:hypothetical protein [Mucilaginibacter sp. SJ]WEA01823.1 hypothetical protein MusilaSJ_02655 [Mucilaginibacter sp. SJ]
MKKLKLMAINLGADEVLSRVQLKNVLGGTVTTSTGQGVPACVGKACDPVTGSFCDSLCFCNIDSQGRDICAKR